MSTQPIRIRNVMLGEGMPKICVPIVSSDIEEICKEAEMIKTIPADIVEWRVDWYQDSKEISKVITLAARLRSIFGETPILFTIRTSDEGGELSYTKEEYTSINLAIAQSGYVDMIDVEIFKDLEIEKFIYEIHKVGMVVVASNHNFTETPNKEEILRRLKHMDEMGADVLKIAVMPQSSEDVLTLLESTRKMVEEKTRKPVVTMSMGTMGVISRIAGETWGSAMTFGAGEAASAPGQLEAVELKNILNSITRF